MDDAGDMTLYNLVVTDATSGQRRVVNERSPLVGLRQAEGEVQHMERINRNPNLRYSVERSRQRAHIDTEIVPEALLTHKFRVR